MSASSLAAAFITIFLLGLVIGLGFADYLAHQRGVCIFDRWLMALVARWGKHLEAETALQQAQRRVADMDRVLTHVCQEFGIDYTTYVPDIVDAAQRKFQA